MIGHLRSGDWLTRDRVTRVAVISAIACVGLLGFILVSARGNVDVLGRPVGTDFASFWTAGWLSNHGRVADAWNLQQHTLAMRQAMGDGRIAPTPWFYPPPFLFVAAPLARLPYLAALLLWQLSGVLLLSAALFRVFAPLAASGRAVLVALASPLTWSVLGHGQNAYLTAALLGSGLAALDRPARAGSAFGALVYKPQLGLLLAPYLLLERRFGVLACAVVSAAILISASAMLWGAAAWRAFFGSLTFARTQILEGGAVPFYKSGSLFGAARLWGVPVPLAYGVQLLAAVAALALIWRVRAAPSGVRSAGVCAAIALWTPYVQDYDLAIVAIGAAFLYAEGAGTGFKPWERSALALIWAQPMFAREAAQWLLLPTGPVITALLALLVIRRSRAAEASPAPLRASPSRHSRAASAP